MQKQNELQTRIVQVLATVLQVDKAEDLLNILSQMSEDGRNNLIQFVSTAVQNNSLDDKTLLQVQQLATDAIKQGQVQKAEFGAKLNHINKIRKMSLGSELVNFAKTSKGQKSLLSYGSSLIGGKFGNAVTSLGNIFIKDEDSGVETADPAKNSSANLSKVNADSNPETLLRAAIEKILKELSI